MLDWGINYAGTKQRVKLLAALSFRCQQSKQLTLATVPLPMPCNEASSFPDVIFRGKLATMPAVLTYARAANAFPPTGGTSEFGELMRHAISNA